MFNIDDFCRKKTLYFVHLLKMVLTEAISKLEAYCAYQERCEQEVRDKMAKLTVPTEMHPEIFQYLREQGFLDDARFGRDTLFEV